MRPFGKGASEGLALDLVGLVGLMPLGALYPSKSGLMNKHIVKHIALWDNIVKHISFLVPCARLSPD